MRAREIERGEETERERERERARERGRERAREKGVGCEGGWFQVDGAHPRHESNRGEYV